MSTPVATPVPLSNRIDPSAIAALFGMTVARLIRGRRLVVLGFLFALPIAFAVLAQRYNPEYDADDTANLLIFGLIPQTLLPLTALVYASGMIQDEIEEQTLTYLLIRPLPRWAIYAVKLAATTAVTAAITAVFTAITFVVVYRGELADDLNGHVLKTVAAMFLALAAYGALFGLVSLFLRRALVVGVAYIILFEGVFANIDFMIRKITIMYQYRVLTIRLIDLDARDWNIDMSTAPTATWAALNLAIAAALLAIAGSLAFAAREFRVKTPEGD